MHAQETLNQALDSLNITTGEGTLRPFYFDGIEVGRGDADFGWCVVGHLRVEPSLFATRNACVGRAGATALRIRNMRGTPLELPQ